MSDLSSVLKDVCIYPNPNDGVFFVSFIPEKTLQSVDIKVLINGEHCMPVISIHAPEVGKELHHKVDFSMKPTGTYTVEVLAEGRSGRFTCTKITG